MSDPTAPAVVDDIEVESSTPVTAPVSAPSVAVEAIEEADAIEARDPGDEDEPQPEQPKAKPRNSIQAKIDQAVGRQREAERRADAAERELAQSRQPREQPQARREPQYTRAKPTEAEIGTKYQDYPAFIEDLQDWKLEQRDAQQAEHNQRAAVAQRHEQHATKFSERIAKAEEGDPQFWTKIAPEIADLVPSSSYDPMQLRSAADAARQGNPQARLFLGKVGIADAIFDSEYSTELMAHFSANLQAFQRLSTLPPRLLDREIGRLEGMFSRPAAASSGPAPKTPVISSAPPPIKPVGTTASTAERDPLAEDLDIDEHIRVMNARDKKGRFVR